MFKDNWLTRKWAAMQEKKRLKQHHEQQTHKIMVALDAANAGAVSDIIAQTEAAEFLINKKFDAFMRSAIASDDVACLKAVMQAKPDANVNYNLNTSWEVFDLGGGYTKTPLIIDALNKKSEKIAVFLTKHPELDVQATSYEFSSSYVHGESKKSGIYGEKPSVIAAQNGFDDISAALLLREANDLKQQALKALPRPPLS